jgi:hypothetical protein
VPSSVCFVEQGSKSRRVDLIDVLSVPERCVDHCSSYSLTCVRPDPKERLLRLEALPSAAATVDRQFVVVYQGSKRGLWESIEVGRLAPRFWIVPAGLPHGVELVLECVPTPSFPRRFDSRRYV